MSLKKNLIKNGIASAFQKGIRIVDQLVLVPFFISAWGVDYYGEWLTLTIIPSIMTFADLGFGSAAANAFVLQYLSGKKQEAANTHKTGLSILNNIVFSSLGVSILVLFVLNYLNVFDKSLIDKYDAIIAVFLLMMSKILNFYQQLYEAQYKSARRASLSINLLSSYTLTNILAGLVVLLLGGGVVLFALSNLVVACIFNPLYGYIALKVLKLNETHKGIIDKDEKRVIIKNGFGYLLSPIWQAVYFQGTTFLVRITLGPGAVTIFNTVRTVTRSVNQVFNLVTSAVQPELQYEIGMGNITKSVNIFRKTLLFNIVISILGIIFLSLFGKELYNIWTHNKLNPPSAMWYILIVGIAFNSIWWTCIIVYQAVNKPYGFTSPGLIAALISVVCSYFLAIRYDLVGVAIGSVILDVLMTIFVLFPAFKLLKSQKENPVLQGSA